MFMKLLGAAFILFAILWTFWLLRLHRLAVVQARAAQGWPEVVGEVLECRIGTDESTDSDGNSGSTYYPVLRYRYTVGGTDYEGKRLRFGLERSGSEGTIKAWLMHYREGTRPAVHYNPADPADCVLETVKPNGGYIIAASIGGVLFTLMGLAAALLGGGDS
jgi:hypothetical protein